MELLLLGPFMAVANGEPVDVGRRQERCLLGVLALEAGRAITTDRLLDLLWSSGTGRGAVHTYVARLRARLRPYGIQILTHEEGYILNPAAVEVDVPRFTAYADAADAATDRRQRAVAYQRALALWRGELLADVASDRLRHRLGAGLAERRLACVEGRAAALLDLGQPEQVVSEFGGPVVDHPGREKLVAYVMTAYYQARRQADALALYQSTRAYLADELGIDPGVELRDLHTRILRNDPDLRAPATTAIVPRQLPRRAGAFVGREIEQRSLDDLVVPGASATIAAISGMSGVGKTALAVRWAHSVAARFPDGLLYLDLRGYDLTAPMSPLEALTHLIRSLGHAAAAVPTDEAAAVALYRTLVADRRILVILDNARSAAYVRPLLPSSPTSVVVVTSRDTLTTLVATDGARAIPLDVLTTGEAVDLLRQVLGDARLDAERTAGLRLAQLAGQLPLALRILAARLAVTRQTISALIEELDGPALLDGIRLDDDPQTSIRAVFTYSYHALTTDQQRLFRALGLVAGTDFTPDACAALLDTTGVAATDVLAGLAAAHLVEQRSDNRYVLHDLVRAYAHERALADDTEPDRLAAVARLHDWYIPNARAAAHALFPGVPMMPDAATGADMTEADARAFLDTEIDNIVAAIRSPRTPRDPARICLLADATRNYMALADRAVAEVDQIATIAIDCAEQTQDVRARVSAYMYRTKAYLAADRYEEAITSGQTCTALARECGWIIAQIVSIGDTGIAFSHSGQYASSVTYLSEAAALNRQLGRLVPLCVAQLNLGTSLLRLGRLHVAADTLHQALAVAREHAPRWIVALLLHNLGTVQSHLGDYQQALATINAALAEYQAQGDIDSDSAARAYETLASIHADLDDLDLALAEITQAVDRLDELASPSLPAALNTRGSILRRLGRLDDAAHDHQRALSHARTNQRPIGEADALLGLADIALRTGELPAARRHAERARIIARDRELRVIEGRALTILAHIATWDDPELARILATEALTVHESTGHTPGTRQTLELMDHMGRRPNRPSATPEMLR